MKRSALAKGLVILVLVCAVALAWTWYSAGEPEPAGPVPRSEVRACVREKLADEDWAKEARQEIPRDLVPRGRTLERRVVCGEAIGPERYVCSDGDGRGWIVRVSDSRVAIQRERLPARP